MAYVLTSLVIVLLGGEPQESQNKEAIEGLIARLPESEDFYAGYELASQLGKYGEEAVPHLIKALESKDSNTRKWAARALTNMGAKNAKNASAALLNALRAEKDEKALWYVVQAVGKVHVDPKDSVPALANILEHASLDIGRAVASAIEDLGPDAGEAKPALIRVLATEDEWLQTWILRALSSIGMDEADLQSLRDTPVKLSTGAAWMIFNKLTTHPQWALGFLEKHPVLLEGSSRDPMVLMNLVDRTDPESEPLRKALLGHPGLPASILAWTMQARYVPRIKEMSKGASAYSQTFLSSCARACGEPADKVVAIKPGKPGDFKPSSAWPGSENSRMSSPMSGHRDGFAYVLVTGKLELADGEALLEPHFFETNDRMLLGEKRNDRAQLKYDQKTHRFVLFTKVFAAYSRNPGQTEAGPYQTGNAMIRIEAKNAKPLGVVFYDEMPEVTITLDPLE